MPTVQGIHDDDIAPGVKCTIRDGGWRRRRRNDKIPEIRTGEIVALSRKKDGWVHFVDVRDEHVGGVFRWSRRPRYRNEIRDGVSPSFRCKAMNPYSTLTIGVAPVPADSANLAAEPSDGEGIWS